MVATPESLVSLSRCWYTTTAKSCSHLQDGPGLKDFIASVGVQRPVMGAVEGGVRVPYLREDNVAGQNIREGSDVPLSPHEAR